jgi:hypothetical protein
VAGGLASTHTDADNAAVADEAEEARQDDLIALIQVSTLICCMVMRSELELERSTSTVQVLTAFASGSTVRWLQAGCANTPHVHGMASRTKAAQASDIQRPSYR